MAKAYRGLFGLIRGKIANMVFTSWKGIPVVRSRQQPYTSKTPAQLRQRKKFTLVHRFVNNNAPVINAGFKWNIEKMSELNSASSYNMKWAVKGEELKDIAMDYPRVLVARGDLPKARGGQSMAAPNGNITFSWNFDAEKDISRARDKVLALAYCPTIQRPFYLVDGSVRREDREYTLDLPDICRGQALETYLAFTTENGEEASDSVYLGRLTILDFT